MLELPSGIVTFLFTDIEGSTPLWENMPEAMSSAIALHHSILREGIEVNGGMVFKIIGDAFQAVFQLATHGLNAAIDIQRRLIAAEWPEASGPLKIRMGLHVGPASVDDRGDYAVSHTLNRAARVMSAGHGGQILLSQEAKDLIERNLPGAVSLKDLGEHHMKGMNIPEHLYQVVAPNLAADFPPLVTSLQHPDNLSDDMTSFIGRGPEIAALKNLIIHGAERLVTLTGAGGTGKTRLVIHLARELVDFFQGGVWLVELAPLSDPRLVSGAIAQVFGVHEVSGAPIQETLKGYLQDKHLLLILDNCEHLLQECSELADSLLKGCPRLTLLATSREILNLSGERSFRVPSLAVPDPAHLPPMEQLEKVDAIRLFTDRSRQAEPGFKLDEANAQAVAVICQRLDGIPLAIELAAARMRMMTAPQIAARLDNVFRILTGGSRNVMPRQQTLKAAIDWSYALLSSQERLMLQRLAVFAGSWTLEAAEAVCAGDGIEPFEALDLLGGLVDKSLAQTISSSDGLTRYRMLETVRQYARDRLFEMGGGEGVRDLHLSFYLQVGEQADAELRGPRQLAWLARLEDELENLRLALEWSLAGRREEGLRLASAVMWFWQMRNRHLEGML